MLKCEVNLVGDAICLHCGKTLKVDHPAQEGVRTCKCKMQVLLAKEHVDLSEERFRLLVPKGWRDCGQ